jgi:hypothetical protein
MNGGNESFSSGEYEHNFEYINCAIPPKPKLSQKQLHKQAKEGSYKMQEDIFASDLDFAGSLTLPDFPEEDISCNFSNIKRKRSIKIFN